MVRCLSVGVLASACSGGITADAPRRRAHMQRNNRLSYVRMRRLQAFGSRFLGFLRISFETQSLSERQAFGGQGPAGLGEKRNCALARCAKPFSEHLLHGHHNDAKEDPEK
jgi:hypothetical protein